jgi:hypothetical protein
MKRVISVPVFLLLIFLVSCASLSEPLQGESGEEDVNTAFERVYSSYRSALILDGAQTYTVVKGDFLAAITRKFYGSDNGYFFPLIMLASSEVVLDPELLEPGMDLIIPDLTKNLEDPTARNKIKSFFLDISGVYEKKAATISAETRKTPQGENRYNTDIRTKERLIELANSL